MSIEIQKSKVVPIRLQAEKSVICFVHTELHIQIIMTSSVVGTNLRVSSESLLGM